MFKFHLITKVFYNKYFHSKTSNNTVVVQNYEYLSIIVITLKKKQALCPNIGKLP